MARPFNGMYGGYGAYELKAKYQRNMFAGTLFTVLLVGVVVLAAFIYQQLTKVEAVAMQPTIIKTVADLGPPPAISKPKPRVEITTPNKAAPKVGIPKPVADDEVIDQDVVIASRDEIADIVAPPVNAVTDEGAGEIIVDIADDEFMPDINEFVPVETPAEMIYEEPPNYPRLARQAGMEAVVWIKALVDKNGNVREAVVYKSSGSKAGFDEAAVEAAYKCKYKPAIQNGRPVAIWVAYSVEFTLTDAE